jgi:hypothetical protein
MQVKEVIMPGVWLDENDQLHVSIPDILDLVDLPHTEENKAEAERMVQRIIKKEFGERMKFVANASCPNCGAIDPVPHKDSCPLK